MECQSYPNLVFTSTPKTKSTTCCLKNQQKIRKSNWLIFKSTRVDFSRFFFSMQQYRPRWTFTFGDARISDGPQKSDGPQEQGPSQHKKYDIVCKMMQLQPMSIPHPWPHHVSIDFTWYFVCFCHDGHLFDLGRVYQHYLLILCLQRPNDTQMSKNMRSLISHYILFVRCRNHHDMCWRRGNDHDLYIRWGLQMWQLGSWRRFFDLQWLWTNGIFTRLHAFLTQGW